MQVMGVRKLDVDINSVKIACSTIKQCPSSNTWESGIYLYYGPIMVNASPDIMVRTKWMLS